MLLRVRFYNAGTRYVPWYDMIRSGNGEVPKFQAERMHDWWPNMYSVWELRTQTFMSPESANDLLLWLNATTIPSRATLVDSSSHLGPLQEDQQAEYHRQSNGQPVLLCMHLLPSARFKDSTARLQSLWKSHRNNWCHSIIDSLC
jgi:hypothetical protein